MSTNREVLVAALKTKIENEVDTEIKITRENQLSGCMDNDDYIYSCKIVALYATIREFIHDEYTFMGCS